MSKYDNLSISELEEWIESKLRNLASKKFQGNQAAIRENRDHRDSLVKILAEIEPWVINLQHLLGEDYTPRGGT